MSGRGWYRLRRGCVLLIQRVLVFIIVIRVITFVFVVHDCLHFDKDVGAFLFADFEFVFVVFFGLANVDLFNLFSAVESLWFDEWFNDFGHPLFDDGIGIYYTAIC